jgi:hypothetical protein
MLKEEVEAEDVAQVVAKWTGIPVSRLLEGEVEKLLHVEDRLRQRVVGQDEALLLVGNAVRRSRAGLGDPHRPIGSFLIPGPIKYQKPIASGVPTPFFEGLMDTLLAKLHSVGALSDEAYKAALGQTLDLRPPVGPGWADSAGGMVG